MLTDKEFQNLDHEMMMANIHSRRVIYETILRNQRAECASEVQKAVLADRGLRPTLHTLTEACLNATGE